MNEPIIYGKEKRIQFCTGALNFMPRPSRLSFELLETFLSVVDQGGDASQAAAWLGINQPSMSKRLAQLQHAGPLILSPWLERRGKTWGPTEEGRRMLPAVRSVIRRYLALGDFAAGMHVDAPQVVFACGQQAARTFVPQALSRFRRERPLARFRISTMRGRARIERVANGFLDLATVTFSEAEIRTIARRTLHVDHLRDDPLVLVAGRSGRAPWRGEFARLIEGPVEAEALTRFPMILPEPDAGVRQRLDHDLRMAGLAERLDVVMEVGGWATMLEFVREGVGVGVVSLAACDGERGLLPTKALPPARFRPIELHLICRREPPPSAELDLSADAKLFRIYLMDSLRAVGSTSTQ
jgi:DNA-binding transcriptional LysR family regulator